MQQEWRPVAGYEGRYEVSNDGRVRSVARPLPGGLTRVRQVKSIELMQHGTKRPIVILSYERAQERILVAELVLTAFKGRPSLWHEPRHLDGNVWNNRVENLEWKL